MISIIAAITNNRVIGNNNSIPWHISDDLKRFKSITSNHHVIMGRKTFESINSKPLPNRVNIVVSSNKDNISSSLPIIVTKSLECALLKSSFDQEVFIIGGGQIYNAAMNFANKIYLTRVLETIEGDIFFPEINMKHWEMIEYIGVMKDEKSGLNYCYETYTKKL